MGYDLNGLGMASPPAQHQRIIKNCLLNFERLKQNNVFESLQTPSIDLNDLDSIEPDLAFYGNNYHLPSVILEVERAKTLSRVYNKLSDVFLNYPSVEEFFVYIYDKDEFRLYFGIDKKDYTEISFSEILNLDLKELVQPPPPRNAKTLNGTTPQNPIFKTPM